MQLIVPSSPFSCTGQYILHKIFLSKVHSNSLSDCVNVHILLLYIKMSYESLVWPDLFLMSKQS